MTLDDLIERLEEIRRACPAAASATVIGDHLDTPVYDRGVVWFVGDDDDENGVAYPMTPGPVH